MDNVKYIGADEVKTCLTFEQLVPIVEKALGEFSLGLAGGIDQPLRATTTISAQNGFLSAMPSYVASSKALACKLVSVFPSNAAKNLSSHQAIILLFDNETGTLKAILDGEVITAMRTAAASVVATKHLAHKTDVLAVLGSGTQAKSHIVSHYKMFPFKQVNLWNHRLEGAKKLAADLLQESGIVVRVYETVDDCVKEADVIVTATFATKPVLSKCSLQPWVHVNAVGAPRPDQQELETDLVLSSVVYADSYQSAVNEAGDVIVSGATVYGEIGEVINGKKEARRNQQTIFKSLGLALEDAVSAQLVYNALMKK